MYPNRLTSLGFWAAAWSRARAAWRAALIVAVIAGVACGGSQVEPEKSRTRTELAEDLLARRQLEDAEQEALRALDYDPGNQQAHNVLGLIDFVRGLKNFQLLEVDECLTGVDAEALRAEMSEHLLAADAHFQAALEVDGSYAEALSNRGSVALQLGEYRRARELFEEALETPHRLVDIGLTRANLGWAYFHLGDHALAAKALRQALQFSPSMCVAKYRLGRVYFARQEWNKALEQLGAVVESRSCPMQEAHLYLLETHARLGNHEAAAAALASCEALAPRSCIAVQCRAKRNVPPAPAAVDGGAGE